MVWILDKSYIDGFINHKDGQEIKHQKLNIFNKTLYGNTKCYDLGGLIFWFVVFTNEEKKTLFSTAFYYSGFFRFFFFGKKQIRAIPFTKNKKQKKKEKEKTNTQMPTATRP